MSLNPLRWVLRNLAVTSNHLHFTSFEMMHALIVRHLVNPAYEALRMLVLHKC